MVGGSGVVQLWKGVGGVTWVPGVDINTTSCPIKVKSNTIEITVHTSCYCILDSLCVIMQNEAKEGVIRINLLQGCGAIYRIL